MSGLAAQNMFSLLTDDIILNIFHTLEDDPRHWARLACVCTKFSSLIRNSCCRSTCTRIIPLDLLSDAAGTTTAWSSLYKLSVCCPGPLHAGLLLDTSDFGLHRDLGPDHSITSSSSSTTTTNPPIIPPSNDAVSSHSCWSLYDDLYYDTVYDTSESESQGGSLSVSLSQAQPEQQQQQVPMVLLDEEVREGVASAKPCKKRKDCGGGSCSSHLASGTRNLSREQGSKLLARQFRDDCLYICDWPGCVHSEEKRNYRLFRGVFKNFKKTRVWRTIHDGKKKRIDLGCAFCLCDETWDLLSAFCLRRGFGYHDDGEPVVRAFVCENGHVSGAWTDVPMYT